MPLEYLWAWSPCQDAVGVPAALRWQTAAGGIGNPTGHWTKTWLECPGSAEVADSRRRHRQPGRALCQDAVRVPAALRWQTVAGGIGSRKGKGPTKWEGPPAAICHCNIHHSNSPSNHSRNPVIIAVTLVIIATPVIISAPFASPNRKSPAIRTSLLWLSAGGKAGRCVHFARTCHRNSLSAMCKAHCHGR